MAPEHLCQKFLKMRTDYDTRGFSSRLQLPLPKTNYCKKRYVYRGAFTGIWKKWSQSCKDFANVSYRFQRAKKVVSDSPGLLDFATGPVNSVINLPDGKVKSFEEFKLQKNCEINLLFKTFLGLVEMMLGLVNVSFSLPEWQAVKMTFSAPWLRLTLARNLY